MFVTDIQLKMSRFGNPVLAVSGYEYHRIQKKSDRNYWRCKRHFKGCKALLHTLEDFTIIRVVNDHNH